VVDASPPTKAEADRDILPMSTGVPILPMQSAHKWTESGGWQTVPRTAAEVNAANAECAKHDHELDHDGINRGILIETRAKRLGVWGLCPFCEGHGTVFTEPRGHLNVVLWILHPRKGCSRGVRVRKLSEVDAEAVKRWLAQAAERNAQRFGKVASK
jgi:hypothetical protein